jgi:hypothetical protein
MRVKRLPVSSNSKVPFSRTSLTSGVEIDLEIGRKTLEE